MTSPDECPDTVRAPDPYLLLATKTAEAEEEEVPPTLPTGGSPKPVSHSLFATLVASLP
jgi:hypothetical protein